MYLLKLALRPFRRAPFSQVFSAVAVGTLALMIGFLFWIQGGLRPVLNRLNGEQVITAYLNPSVESSNEGKIVDSIQMSLGAQVSAEVALVDTRKFLSQLRGHYPELAQELENFGSEANSIIPRYVSVTGLLPDSALEKIRSLPGIESAETSKSRYRHVVGAFLALRWVVRVLAFGLCLALLTGLIHLARMNSYLHADALSLLRLWGAGEWSLRIPGMISGLIVGSLGGLISATGWVTVGPWLYRQISAFSPALRDMPSIPLSFALGLFTASGVLGILAGVVGSVSHRDAGFSESRR